MLRSFIIPSIAYSQDLRNFAKFLIKYEQDRGRKLKFFKFTEPLGGAHGIIVDFDDLVDIQNQLSTYNVEEDSSLYDWNDPTYNVEEDSSIYDYYNSEQDPPSVICRTIYGLALAYNTTLPFEKDIDLLFEQGIIKSKLSQDVNHPCYLGVISQQFDQTADETIRESPALEDIQQFKDLFDRAIKSNISQEFRDRLLSMRPVMFITWKRL